MTTAFASRVDAYVRSGVQALFVAAPGEGARAELVLIEAARKLSSKKRMEVLFWDCVQGFTGVLDGSGITVPEGVRYRDIQKALQFIAASDLQEDVLFVFRDAHPFLNKVPEVRRCFLNMAERNLFSVDGRYRRPIVFLSNSREMHDEVRHHLTEVDFDLPDADYFSRTVVAGTEAQVKGQLKTQPGADCPPDLRNKVVQTLLGMTENEADRAIKFSVRENRGWFPGVLDSLEEEKAKTLRSSRVLTYIPRSKVAGMDSLAGYDNLLAYIRTRKLAFTPEARAAGLPYPRGLILLGAPGTAKSMCAKALAKELEMPLLIMDYAAVKGSLVGESETRLKDTLAQVRAIKRSVLLIDS